jgi:hypothetical protein
MIRSKTFQTDYTIEDSGSSSVSPDKKVLKKSNYDKAFEDSYLNATPVVERKFYDGVGGNISQYGSRRASEFMFSGYTGYTGSKIERYYNDSGSASTQGSVENCENIPKRIVTSLDILKAPYNPDKLITAESGGVPKDKSYFVKYAY